MPVYGVSCSDEDTKFLSNSLVSKSKIFQLGIAVAKNGGVESFEKTIKEIEQLKQQLPYERDLALEWRKKFFEIKRELNAFQIVYGRTSVLQEAEEKEAQAAEKLLREKAGGGA